MRVRRILMNFHSLITQLHLFTKAGDPRIRYGNGFRGSGIRSISKPRNLRGFRDASGQLVLDHDEENLSEKELYARNIPAIGQF